MKTKNEIILSHRKSMLMRYSKDLIEVLNDLDENNAYKDTKRHYSLLGESYWLRSRIDLLHIEIEYLENKIKGED